VVAVTGPIAYIALAGPHLARRLLHLIDEGKKEAALAKAGGEGASDV
jgi:ABC-type enterobactin transport system permease subunit